MTGFLPLRPWGGDERSDRPEPRLRGTLTEAERIGRWEVRAAQWRALELARVSFGEGVRSSMVALRARGPMRGLLRLDVPFDPVSDEGLARHRSRERAFLTAVADDPLLAQVPLVYVFAAEAAALP